jgi:DNA-binding NarL/FixJ family response regulator
MGPKLVLADPQPFFRRALSTALAEQGDFHPVGSSAEEEDSVSLATRLDADLVLTEVQLIRGSGLHLATRLSPEIPVIVLTRQHEGDVLMDVAASGAMGCISHATGFTRLVELLHESQNGRFCIDHDRLAEILRRAGRSRGVDRDGNLDVLTVREREVLFRLASGASDDAIAGSLHISRHTVRTHVGNLMQKLGVHSRAEAARSALAWEHDLTTRPQVLRIEGPGWGQG